MSHATTEVLRQRLRAAGLRATPSRLAVLSLLVRRAPRALSHADAVAALVDGNWDAATIYRNLLDMVSAGLARRVDVGDRVWRFVSDSGQADHAHPHFVCTECGETECLPGAKLTFASRKAPRMLSERAVELQVRGVCDNCG